jgi:hypothetical protein
MSKENLGSELLFTVPKPNLELFKLKKQTLALTKKFVLTPKISESLESMLLNQVVDTSKATVSDFKRDVDVFTQDSFFLD